jgi:uncharacterized protein (UPF0548 family)
MSSSTPRLRRPSPAALQELLAEQQRAQVTYAEAGATRTGDLPAGYHHDHYRRRLGAGAAAFAAARAGLREWASHRSAGITLTPPCPLLEVDGTVVQLISTGPMHAVAACRILYIVDEATRYGFAYGTLPAHPEQGEEAFMVSIDEGSEVWFDVTAFSKPRDLLARLGAPVARRLQVKVTTAYLDGLERFVAEAQGSK